MKAVFTSKGSSATDAYPALDNNSRGPDVEEEINPSPCFDFDNAYPFLMQGADHRSTSVDSSLKIRGNSKSY